MALPFHRISYENSFAGAYYCPGKTTNKMESCLQGRSMHVSGQANILYHQKWLYQLSYSTRTTFECKLSGEIWLDRGVE